MSHPDLAGKRAVVTGGARGIGAGIAKRFLAEGMQVLVADLHEEAVGTFLDVHGDSGRAFGMVGDMGELADIDRLFETVDSELGGIDVLVNNAASMFQVEFLADHEPLLEKEMAVNVLGPYRASQRAAARMRDAGTGGSIISISSVGALRAHREGFPYDVTKGAINALTVTMAVDLGKYGIRANAIGPGLTHTWRTDGREGTPKYRSVASSVPLQRHGTVDDIAGAAAFLASNDSSYVTGQVLYVDGGMTAQLSTPPPPDGLPVVSAE
jgi:3-oxoacyl-[acyl-carrier protein] reductase